MSSLNMKELRKGIQQNAKKLEQTLAMSKKTQKRLQHKDFYKKYPNDTFDKFYERIQKYDKKRERHREELVRTKEKNDLEGFFSPRINKNSRRITEGRPSLMKRVEKMTRTKSAALLRKRNESVKSTTSRDLNPKEIQRINDFYNKKLEWKKNAEHKIFYNKMRLINEKREKEKIPDHYFKPQLNSNRRMVKEDFGKRIKNFDRKKSRDLIKIEKEMYGHSFTPSLHKKYRKTYY